MLRIIDKETQLFLRDDFTFDEETEIGLDTEPSQGLYAPKWDGTQWIETGQAPEPTPQEPTELEILQAKIKASNEYTDFLEEVIVDMAQVVYR